jgi:hypothetical protein
MSYSPILGNPKPQYEDSNGDPYVGMRLFFYAAGTSTKLATKTDSTGAVDNTNPVVLDSDGFPTGNVMIYGANAVAYKVVAAPAGTDDPPTSPLWTIDNVIPGATLEAEWINPLTAIRTATTTFTVVGDQTASFHLGRRIKGTGGADRYAVVVSSAFTTLTTVTVANITDNAGATTTLHASMDTAYVSLNSADSTSAAINFYPTQSGETGVTDNTFPTGNVKRYGAKVDGSTDDTAAIGNADTSAAALGISLTGGDGGISIVSDQLTATTSWISDITFKLADSTDITAYAIPANGLIHSATSGVVISVNVDGNSGNSALAGALISMTTGTDNKVNNCRLTNIYSYGVFSSINDNIEISNNYLEYHATHINSGGITIGNSDSVSIHHNQVVDAVDDAIAVHVCTNWVMNDNILDNKYVGGSCIGVGGLCLGGVIQNNVCQMSGDNGSANVIKIGVEESASVPNRAHCEDIVISNNYLSVASGFTIGSGIRIIGSGTNIDIIGNEITGAGTYGNEGIDVVEQTFEAVTYTPTLIRVKDNKIKASGTGLNIDSACTDSVISGNEFEGCTTAIFQCPPNSVGRNRYINCTNWFRTNAAFGLEKFQPGTLHRIVFALEDRASIGSVNIPLLGDIDNYYAYNEFYVVGLRAHVDALPVANNLNVLGYLEGVVITGASVQFTSATALYLTDNAFSSGPQFVAVDEFISIVSTVSGDITTTPDMYVEAYLVFSGD